MKTTFRVLLTSFAACLSVNAADWAPSSIRGRDLGMFVLNGKAPFYTCGSYRLVMNSTNNSFRVINNCSTLISTGTYQYTKLSTNMARVAFNDSFVGQGTACKITFQSPHSGNYLMTNTVSVGMQAGKFLNLNPNVR